MTLAPVTRRTVGSWEILDVIGSGSFAIVWKARHAATGGLAAVKEILADRLNKKLQESLESEIAVLQRLKHTNIVGLLDLYKEPGKIFLVLEYCGGGDLAQHLRQRGPLSEASCRYLLRQLAEGLKVLRQNNVIHRDLKPQNLLLSDNGPSPTLKIADFGFARSLQPAGLAETLCGSPLYMAPEVLQLHRYDAKADLWSVGTILFELLTGKPPFSGANHYQLVQNIERGDAVLPDPVARTLSAGCRQLLHQLLRRNPVERISFDEFFAHPFLIGEAASAAVTPLPPGAGGSAAATTATTTDSAAAAAAHLRSASAAAAAIAWATPQPAGGAGGGVARRYTPSSQGAVRFIQPVSAGSPVHPAFQVPASPTSPPAARQPGTTPQPPQQPWQEQQAARPAGSAPPASGGASRADQGAAAAGARGAGGGLADTGPSGANPGGTGGLAPPAINVRELTRSPSPRVIAAAAAAASSLVEDPPAAPAAGLAATAAPGPPAQPTGPPAQQTAGRAVAGGAAARGTVSGGGGIGGVLLGVDVAGPLPGGLSGSLSLGSSRPLADSLDSDYVVVSSPSAAFRPQAAAAAAAVPLSPRTPHPAMAAAYRAGGRSSSAGGALTSSPPDASGSVGGRKGGDAATISGPNPAAAVQPSWQQLLTPIAAATMPPSHGLPYTTLTAASAGLGVMGPQPATGPATHGAAAGGLPAPGSGTAPAGAATTVTVRVPPPGGCCEAGAGGDPQLLPRVVGVLLDHARSRCGALLDAEAEARQLEDTHAAALASAAGQGLAPGCCAHQPGMVAGGSGSEMADEAAGAVGTLLVACRLLVAGLCATGGGGVSSRGSVTASSEGASRGASSGGGSSVGLHEEEGADASPASPSSPPSQLATHGSSRICSSPSPAALAALAGHARSMLAALDEHLHGTVARLLLEGPDSSGAAVPASASTSPDSGPYTVPCGLDALLAVAVHHSRAAAGEELLGNAAGAAEHYSRAADVLLFLLGAPPPHQQHQQHQQPGTQGLQLDSLRPPLSPHDRQRLTRYYAAVRLRQSAALEAAGPTPPRTTTTGPLLPSAYHHYHHNHHERSSQQQQQQHMRQDYLAPPAVAAAAGGAHHPLNPPGESRPAGGAAGGVGRRLGPVSLAAGPGMGLQVQGGVGYGYEQARKDFGAFAF